MIRVVAVVAMDYGLIFDRDVILALPKDVPLFVGSRIPCTFPGHEIVTNYIPNTCFVVGAYDTGIKMAEAVTLVVQPEREGGKQLKLDGFVEESRTIVGENTVVNYTRVH